MTRVPPEGQPHLAVHRLGQLLFDAVHGENVGSIGAAGGLVLGEPPQQIGSDRVDVRS